ncbi:hypothetical protein V8C40DRAFT_175061 [Trichoderma camerunense]
MVSSTLYPGEGQSVYATIGHIRQSESYRTEKPFEILVDTEPGQPVTNVEFGAVEDVLTRDARHHGLGCFSLNSHGFRFLEYDCGDDLEAAALVGPNRDLALQAYLKRLQTLVTRELDAKTVILYDWRMRSSKPGVAVQRSPDRFQTLRPARWVHADESGLCGRNLVREHLTEKEQKLFDEGIGRFRIINIWRPLVPVVLEKPLGLCNWASVQSEDWETCDQVLSDRVDEAMYLKHEERHEWWWLPQQRSTELTLFVVWDSAKFREGLQASTPHAAISLNSSNLSSEKEYRVSIEVRSIVWTAE